VELLGWAAFTAPACAVALGFFGVGWLLAIGVGLLIAAVFAVVWAASLVAGPGHAPSTSSLGTEAGSPDASTAEAGEPGRDVTSA
jgi:hypothetical protein